MGHKRLGTLPKTQKWEHVVGLIAGGADVDRIAAASADAAETLDRIAISSPSSRLPTSFYFLRCLPSPRHVIRVGATHSESTFLKQVLGPVGVNSRRYRAATSPTAPPQSADIPCGGWSCVCVPNAISYNARPCCCGRVPSRRASSHRAFPRQCRSRLQASGGCTKLI